MSPAEATPQVLAAPVCRLNQLPEHDLCTKLAVFLNAYFTPYQRAAPIAAPRNNAEGIAYAQAGVTPDSGAPPATPAMQARCPALRMRSRISIAAAELTAPAAWKDGSGRVTMPDTVLAAHSDETSILMSCFALR